MDKLIIPDDLEANEDYDDEIDYNDDLDEKNVKNLFDEEDEDEEEKKDEGPVGEGDDAIDEVFAQARENKEMNIQYANEGMLGGIENLEDQMMDQKKWQLKGEI